jgi:hypothetical protein
LRAKLGDALPLETLRGSGYKLRAPDPKRRPRAKPKITKRRGRRGKLSRVTPARSDGAARSARHSPIDGLVVDANELAGDGVSIAG